MKKATVTINERQLAAILTGLRLIQADGFAVGTWLDEVYTNCGDLLGLDADELDELCEALNYARWE